MRKKESFFRFTQQRFNDRLLKYVLNVNLSFRAIESSFFKNFVKYLRRDVDIFERIFFEEMMKKRANQIKNDLFQNLEIEIKIFIVLNVWISFNHFVFMNVIAYFVDCEFRFREAFIAFKFLLEQHTNEKLTEAIMNILQVYKFIRKLMTIIADNASNNATLRKHLFEKLTKMNVNWDFEIDIINCMTHVLQLFVIALLTALRMQVFNDDVNMKFDEKSLIKIFVATFFENILRKIIIHLFCLISID
jgi:predicted metal-binding protein